MSKFIYAVFIPAFLGANILESCYADEIQRLNVDLDGDGKPEVISISRDKTSTAWREKIIVQIGESKFEDEYFSRDNDIPSVRVVYIDRKRPQRQLLLETPEAGSCVFHLISYPSNRLVRLIRHDSGPSCQSPDIMGNGQIGVSVWEGFWNRIERSHLNKNGDALIPDLTNKYPVDVPGVAGKNLLLQGAECPSKTVKQGIFVKVTRYEAKEKRYRVESADGGCGWLSYSSLSEIDGPVKELPWAE